MKRFIILFFFLSVSFNSAQTKYLIYFKDKGVAASASLNKTSSLFKLAEKQLSPAAIERRKQVMGEENYITFEDIPISGNYINQIESLGIKIVNKLNWFNAVSAYLTDIQLTQLKNFHFVLKIENVKIFNSVKPQEQNIYQVTDNSEIALKKVTSKTGLNYGASYRQAALSEIPEVHDLGFSGAGVYIGILDNGFNYKTTTSLMSRAVLREYNYVTKTADVSNYDTHGTGVFSIMAGYAPGNIIGPAYGANFFLAKTEVDGSETNVEEDNYAAALQDMENAGVDITSSSLGYNIFDTGQRSYTYAEMDGNTTTVAKAAKLAFQRGVATFTAAGNEASFWGVGKGGLNSPGDENSIITVGAVDSLNSMAGFSSRGPTSDGRIKPEIVAMGVSVNHAISGNSYGRGSGTSYATPIAAGIAGLLKSAWPHLTNLQIRNIFLESGDNSSSPNNDRGYGLISAKKAVSYPNLSLSGGIYQINKIFIDPNTVNTSSVQINYKIGSGSFQTAAMNYDGNIKFNFQLPPTANGTSIEFYFTYQNNIGSVREPAGTNNYKLFYGNLNINNLTSVDSQDELPYQFNLSQNYPNPFNPETIVNFDVPYTSRVSLKIYDLLGREVANLFDEVKQPGSYKASISALKLGLSSGVYFYSLKSDRYAVTKKMVLIK